MKIILSFTIGVIVGISSGWLYFERSIENRAYAYEVSIFASQLATTTTLLESNKNLHCAVQWEAYLAFGESQAILAERPSYSTPTIDRFRELLESYKQNFGVNAPNCERLVDSRNSGQ